ncbi:preprotein translocase subunit SecE [Schnuerera sp. xch1]|uniref:preprotein translocase subunit SecE n=1 Tax=Schnuerera sp. xch1 TaxID=2874283 RepID=UPI001CBC0CA7|nr:preprotein translocase subunit SecE [Schnuerera sp. xch1]MBZ2175220.1 preprotein translocase subunit SecE [Schnuerera sp. xch1]
MSAQTGIKKSKIRTYFKGVKAEIKKVTWPNKRELINYTLIVILVSAIVALFVWIFDFGIQRILSLII